MTIHLLCDRCRAEGQTGDDPFAAYADLLDFTPVPRRKKRADGWDGEVQRAFIAALAATGSARQAAGAVGKAAFGVNQLKESPGNESFMAAYARALDHFAENRSLRLADGVRNASALATHRHTNAPKPAWSRAATRRGPGPAPAAEPEDEEAEAQALLETLLRAHLLKLGAEREARTAGRIAEADFYLRQLTFIEVALDAAADNAFDLLRELRIGGRRILDVARTPMAALLDDARRAHWERCGDPPRPGPPAPDLLLPQPDGIVTEPTLYMSHDPLETPEERSARYEATYKREAEAHIEWEAAARRDYEARREASQPHGRRDEQSRPAGREASPSDVTEFTSVTAPQLAPPSQPAPAPQPDPDPNQ